MIPAGPDNLKRNPAPSKQGLEAPQRSSKSLPEAGFPNRYIQKTRLLQNSITSCSTSFLWTGHERKPNMSQYQRLMRLAGVGFAEFTG